jgi:hypothetical protein
LILISLQIALALVAVIVLIGSSEARMRRSPQPGLRESGETWTPVREPKEFSINVADGIQGANQIRHEKWDNGDMTGMYAQPMGGKKWQIVSYTADKNGYRITS